MDVADALNALLCVQVSSGVWPPVHAVISWNAGVVSCEVMLALTNSRVAITLATLSSSVFHRSAAWSANTHGMRLFTVQDWRRPQRG